MYRKFLFKVWFNSLLEPLIFKYSFNNTIFRKKRKILKPKLLQLFTAKEIIALKSNWFLSASPVFSFFFPTEIRVEFSIKLLLFAEIRILPPSLTNQVCWRKLRQIDRFKHSVYSINFFQFCTKRVYCNCGTDVISNWNTSVKYRKKYNEEIILVQGYLKNVIVELL